LPELIEIVEMKSHFEQQWRVFHCIATIHNQGEWHMKKFSQFALVGALAVAFAGSAMAQAGGGGGGPATDESKPAVHPKEPVPHLKHHHKKKTAAQGASSAG
jgi:hypothetical protein